MKKSIIFASKIQTHDKTTGKRMNLKAIISANGKAMIHRIVPSTGMMFTIESTKRMSMKTITAIMYSPQPIPLMVSRWFLNANAPPKLPLLANP